MNTRPLSLFVFAAAAALASPRVAHACGGCFAPPGAVQSVTDHRMVLSVSSTQTTLWDQFRYAGSPTEFSWILPIHYGPSVQVALADDRFLTVLDNLSVPVLTQPYAPGSYCGGEDNGYPAGAADAASAADGGVVVHREEVVGPYDVAIIGGENPMAIRDWLASHGFSVPPSVSPVIDYYTGLHMDYVALRLHPGEGIDRMSPVRVTVPGSAPTLPLRMISAGISDRVGLVLLVLAEGRMEAQNFPNGEVQESDLTWDWNHPSNPVTDFRDAFDRVNAAHGNRAWITESAQGEEDSTLLNLAQNSRYVLASDAGTCGSDDAGPGDVDAGGDPTIDGGPSDVDASGSESDSGATTVPTCIATDPVDDMHLALDTLGANVVLTRLHADLAGTMLDRDLQLQASTAGDRQRFYSYGHIVGSPPAPPPCPHYDSDAGGWVVDEPDGARVVTYPDGGHAVITEGGCSGGARCSAARVTGRGAPRASLFAVAALALVIRRRKRNG